MKMPKHKEFGYSIEESIARIPNELDYDAVGLWQIIPVGRQDFELSGNELIDFTKRHILALLEKGAVPVKSSNDPSLQWIHQKQYGTHANEIADKIIQEWLDAESDPDVSGLWFNLPEEKPQPI